MKKGDLITGMIQITILNNPMYKKKAVAKVNYYCQNEPARRQTGLSKSFKHTFYDQICFDKLNLTYF